ncbi:uncharacterized protein LOC101861646 isoform X2 [Aplysia californica]|uniref:Uncharacterized protein LOC101861646 isoform X2 n=1 Tax=Aplysia californica TaxID=6500 RepID=A0ABM0JGG5_APLCA|nr:uncharacterized protein LOC101861646 isoform X2 [Aplysia californica]
MTGVRDTLEDSFLDAYDDKAEGDNRCCLSEWPRLLSCGRLRRNVTQADLHALLAEEERDESLKLGLQDDLQPDDDVKSTGYETGVFGQWNHFARKDPSQLLSFEELRERSGLPKSPMGLKAFAMAKFKKWKKKEKTDNSEINRKSRFSSTLGNMFVSRQSRVPTFNLKIMGQDCTPEIVYLIINRHFSKRSSSIKEERASRLTLNDIQNMEDLQTVVSDRSMSSTYRHTPTVTSSITFNTVASAFSSTTSPVVRKDSQPKLSGLPSLLSSVTQELEMDWKSTQSLVKTLCTYMKAYKVTLKGRKVADKWMVIFYTSSENLDPFSEFCCVLARSLLQHYCVAYEERDIAVKKFNYYTELKERLGGKTISLPYLFASGMSLGGCKVLYAIHKLDVMDSILGNYMMTKEMYSKWMQRGYERNVLSIKVPLQDFPVLRRVAQGLSLHLKREDMRFFADCKDMVTKAKQQWKAREKMMFTETDLLRFVLLKSIVRLTFQTMDGIMRKSILPNPRFSSIWGDFGREFQNSP